MCENCFQKECCEFCDKRKEIPFRDKGNRQEYRIINENSSILICKIKIDKCLISDGEKCDYLAIKCSKEKRVEALCFIELKGSDLIKAINQIKTTINHIKIKPLLKNKPKVYARVVLNKQNSPNIRSSEKIKFEKMIKSLNGNLKTQSKKMVETIECKTKSLHKSNK